MYMKNLSSYLKSIEQKIIKAEKKASKEPYRLFVPELTNEDWVRIKESVRNKRCPHCGSLLKKVPFNRPRMIMCEGRRHDDKKPYILTPEGYKNIIK